MADENGDVKQASLEDSNMANYGGKEMRDLRKDAAASDSELKGAGTKVGLEVWRVENRRTESDTPDFGIKRWPKEDNGSFFSGDSYIVLNTYNPKDPETGKINKKKLAWDVHFWLGSESSQDEIGVAAYKTIEIDDLLDDGPVQHREVQGNESQLFQSYFPAIQYMEGGIASGFRKVKPEEYEPRLFMVRKAKRTMKVSQVSVKASSMNHGDAFILDAGLKVYLWVGDTANAFEKARAAAVQANIINSRMGKAKKVPVDDDFWKILGGSESDVLDADDPSIDKPKPGPVADPNKLKLYRVSDASGKLEFTLEAEGQLNLSMFDSDDVFIVDAQAEIYVWIGKGATKQEKNKWLIFVDKLIADKGLAKNTPVSQVKDGHFNAGFGALLTAK